MNDHQRTWQMKQKNLTQNLTLLLKLFVLLPSPSKMESNSSIESLTPTPFCFTVDEPHLFLVSDTFLGPSGILGSNSIFVFLAGRFLFKDMFKLMGLTVSWVLFFSRMSDGMGLLLFGFCGFRWRFCPTVKNLWASALCDDGRCCGFHANIAYIISTPSGLAFGMSCCKAVGTCTRNSFLKHSKIWFFFWQNSIIGHQ